jgi:hypothetical protein
MADYMKSARGHQSITSAALVLAKTCEYQG